MSWIRQHSPAGTPPRARPGPGSPPSLPHPANHTRKSHGHQPKATERQRSSPAQVAANQAAAAIGTRVKPDLGRRRRARRELSRSGAAAGKERVSSDSTRNSFRSPEGGEGFRPAATYWRARAGGHATRGVGNWESVGATGPEVGTGERRAARAAYWLARGAGDEEAPGGLLVLC